MRGSFVFLNRSLTAAVTISVSPYKNVAMQAEEYRRRIGKAFCNYLRQDNLRAQIFFYGVAGVGLLVALRRVRPFARFAKPSDIPNHFIKSKVRIGASIVRIEPRGGGPLLMVETEPVLPLPHFGRSKQLPIKIANVDVTANGTSWLQSVTAGKTIVFVPLVKNKDSVEARIFVVEPNEESLDIGKELVRLGFGMVREVDPVDGRSKDKDALTYRASLLAAQKWAVRQRNGHWHYNIQPTLLWKLRNSLTAKAKSALPAFLTRQLNI